MGGRLDDAALDDAMRETGVEAHRCRAAQRGAAAVRRGARDAGRPEGADHPRLLHAAAAAVSVRGQCRGALSRCSTRPQQNQILEDIRRDVLLEAARQPDSAVGRALDRPSFRIASDFTFQICAERGDPRAQRDRGLGRARRRPRRGDGAAFGARSASSRTRRSPGSRAADRRRPALAVIAQWASRRRDLRAELEDRPGPGRALDRSAGTLQARRGSTAYLSVFFYRQGRAAQTGRHGRLGEDAARSGPPLRRRTERACPRSATSGAPSMTRDRTMALLTIATRDDRSLHAPKRTAAACSTTTT